MHQPWTFRCWSQLAAVTAAHPQAAHLRTCANVCCCVALFLLPLRLFLQLACSWVREPGLGKGLHVGTELWGSLVAKVRDCWAATRERVESHCWTSRPIWSVAEDELCCGQALDCSRRPSRRLPMSDQAHYCTTVRSASKTHSSEAVQIADVLCWASWNGYDMQCGTGQFRVRTPLVSQTSCGNPAHQVQSWHAQQASLGRASTLKRGSNSVCAGLLPGKCHCQCQWQWECLDMHGHMIAFRKAYFKMS